MSTDLRQEAVTIWSPPSHLVYGMSKAHGMILEDGANSLAPPELFLALDEALQNNYGVAEQQRILESGRALVALVRGTEIEGLAYANGWRWSTAPNGSFGLVEVGTWTPAAVIGQTSQHERIFDLFMQRNALDLLEFLPGPDSGIINSTQISVLQNNLTSPSGGYRYGDRAKFASITSQDLPGMNVRNALEAAYTQQYPSGLSLCEPSITNELVSANI